MARLFHPRSWSLAVAAGLLVLAAAVNVESLRVPNWLTFPSILVAWIAAAGVSGRLLPSRGGGFGPSLLLTFFAGMLLALPYGAGWLGAGCVKMHMALGAWIGCAYSAEQGAKVTIGATLVGGLASAAGFVVQAAWLAGNEPGAYWPLFPAQATLSLGAIAVLLVAPLLIRSTDEEFAPPAEASDEATFTWTTSASPKQ